jgi:hypothetical protein
MAEEGKLLRKYIKTQEKGCKTENTEKCFD